MPQNELDKSQEDVEHVLSQCKDVEHVLSQCKDVEPDDGNVMTILQENLSLDAAAGQGETLSMNQQDKCYNGVKYASGQLKNGTVRVMSHESSDLTEAVGEGEMPPMNQLDKSYESVKHAVGQCKDGNVRTMPEESSSFDVATSESETPQMNQLDISHEDVRYDSGQLEDGIVNIMLQKCSDIDEPETAKDICTMMGQQKDVIAQPRGMEPIRMEHKNDDSIIGNRDDDISFLASSTIHIDLAEKSNTRTEQRKWNSDQKDNISSRDQKEPWTSNVCNGESSDHLSDIPPCVQSMDKDSSPNREVNAHRSDKEEQWVAGMCPGDSAFKETEVPHFIKSMEDGNMRPASNGRFLKKRKHEVATTSIGTEQESCFKTRQQGFLSVRKVPMSKAAKIFGIRY